MRSFSLGVCLLLSQVSFAADDPVFSGPQVGEALPPLTMRVILGADAGREVDIVATADGKPTLLLFVHERTRPAFGLANALMRFASTRESAGLVRALIFLDDDPTQSETWLKQIPQYFVKDAPVGVSADGEEGPGAYGLNRNVSVTVLVATGGKVTANFALVQPSVQADGPRILKALVEVTGGGDVPDITEFAGQRMTDQRPTQDPKLQELLRAVIQKDADSDGVQQAVEQVDKYVAQQPRAARELGEICARVSGSERFDNYGTPAAREAIQRWAQTHQSSKPARRMQPKD